MSALWTSAEAEAAVLGQASAPFQANGISIDTRSLKTGDLFVALHGDARDGHEFVAQAFRAGASAALVSRAVAGLPDGAPLLTAGHTLRALEDLGSAARARSHAKVIGVTGSAGKTTTKEMLRLACGALGRTHASAASYNNHWGVPLTLAQLPREADYAVIEIGMNHFGEIRSLVSFVRPDVAVITTIAAAHLEFFGTLEAIADAKSEIFEGVIPGGSAILPADSPYAGRLAARAKRAHAGRLLSFGSAASCDGRLIGAREHEGGQIVEAQILGQPVRIRLGAQGAHIAMNAVAALLTVADCGGDVLNAAAALSQFEALKGRGARWRVAMPGGHIDVIDESYNANPASMAAALALLGSAQGRRIAVLGDMLEMGPQGHAMHAALLSRIEAANVDLIFACGAQMRALWDVLPESRRGAHDLASGGLTGPLLSALQPGDTVLVKGSLGSKMAVVIEALKSVTG